MNDPELLQAWATRRDDSAFAELVRRHLPLVHASALRQVRDPGMAQDVSQSVFLVLARKAGSLGDRPVLAGWLLRTTRFVAARALRAERRRTHHETAAAMQPDSPASLPPPEHWDEVEPLLDAALAALPSQDRDAVALRYLEGRPLRAVGESLGIGEEAAKKRVHRAVDRMRAFLAGRGVVLPAAALAVLLDRIPSTAAPAPLADRISTMVATGTAGPALLTLMNVAIRDGFLARVRAITPWAAAALVLILAGLRTAVSRPAEAGAAAGGGSTAAPIEVAPVEPVATPPVVSAGLQPGPSKLLLNVRSARDNRPLVAEVLVGHWQSRTRVRFENLRTDSDGSAEVPLDGAALREAVVTLSAPGHVPIEARWQRHELVEPVLLYPVRLEAGETLAGEVRDEDGVPVADARIQFAGPWLEAPERERIRYLPAQTGVNSDAEGRFRSDQMPRLNGLGAMRYTVSHPRFVRTRVVLDGPDALAAPQRVILRRGPLLSGRVVTSEGLPVPGALVMEAPNLEGSECRTRTTDDGTFELGPLAPGPVEVHASADGFQSADQTFAVPSTNGVVIRLETVDDSTARDDGPTESRARISGTVVDAHSGAPVGSFRVRMRTDGGPLDRFLGEGHSGRFDWPVDLAFVHTFALEVDAEGYTPAESETRTHPCESRPLEFRLTPGGTAHGRVVGPDGTPASGAVIGLTGASMGFYLRDGLAFSGNRAPGTRSAGDGSFSIRLRTHTEMLFAAHPFGFVVVPAEGVTNVLLTLQPWGSIEGTIRVGGRPAPGQVVALRHWMPEEDRPLGPDLDGIAHSDSEGRFRFDHVPPGSVALSRYFNFNRTGFGRTGSGPRHRVEVPAGGIATVTMDCSGRPVTGRFVFEHPVPGYDWRDDLQTLEDVDASSPFQQRTVPGSREFSDVLREARAFARREQASRMYFPVIHPDGSFVIDAVPPGSYRWNLRVSAPPRDDNDSDSRRELGAVTREVVVPDGNDGDPAAPLDLGTIVIPIRQP